MTASLSIKSPPRLAAALPSRRAVNWLLAWVLLPNLAFCALWVVAAPPRAGEIVAVGAIGLLVRRAPYWLRLLAFAAVTVFSILSYISAIFNLAVSNAFASIQFFIELDPLNSPTYLIGGAAMALLLLIAAHMLRRGQAFEAPRDLVLAIGAVLIVAALDYGVSYHSRGSYKHVPTADAAFSSGVDASGLIGSAHGGRHVLLVVVEAMGLPTHPALRDAMFGRWKRSDIAARYDVTIGSTPYYGSTTSGEIRELCGRWADYQPLLDRSDGDCLPAMLARRGYVTTAVHGFTRLFFDRSRWYPAIGFSSMIFGEDLLGQGMAECPGVFPGACDRAIPALLGKRLRSAQPQFLYWLTLNSHLPVPVDPVIGTSDCRADHPDLAGTTGGICRLVSVVAATNDSLAAMLTEAALPPTEILIVGDHMPPFFDHASRSQFDPHRVPWVRLTPKPHK